MPELLESGDEVIIEDCYFSIEDQCGFLDSPNDLGEFTKSSCVIPTIPAKELNPPISLAS